MSGEEQRNVSLMMTPYFWRLLGKYVVVLSYSLVMDGCRKLSLARTVTGIVSAHLLRHAAWIEEEFLRVREAAISAEIDGFFSADDLDAIASAGPAEIAYLVRGSLDRRRIRGIFRGARSLLKPDRKPASPARRLAP